MEDEEGNQFGCPPGKGYSYEDMTNILENIHDYIGATCDIYILW